MLTGSQITASGKSVTPENALRNPAVYAAVRCIAESVAQLPIRIHSQCGADHPLNTLLVDQPNDWTSSFEFRLQMTAALLLHWNAYAWINRDGDTVAEIIQLPNAHVSGLFAVSRG